mgnify:FL=1
MIDVLNIISDSNIGGAGRCVLNFLKYYDRSAFCVTVAVPRGSLLIPALCDLKTPYVEVDGIAETSFSMQGVKNLYRVIGQVNPQVVHTHGNFSGRIAAKLRGKKIVYTRHSVFPVSHRIDHGIGKWLNGRINEFFSDQILAVAQAAKENLIDSGVRPERIEVVLNGVESLVPLPEEEKGAVRQQYGIQQGDFVLGILARVEPYKGHRYLLEAAKIMKQHGRKIRVIIAGVGDALEDLKTLAEQWNITDIVCFAGFVQDVRSLLSVLDLQINASYGTEATSLSLLEGMSLGLPAVVSDYGGNPGVITEGQNGLLVPQKDGQALAAAVERLMGDPALLAQLKAGAKARFASSFTAKIYAGNIEQVYRQTAERRN